jgi:hypothetical protein
VTRAAQSGCVRLLATIALATGLASCGDDATEIVVLVDSDLRVPGEVRSLLVEITNTSGDITPVRGDLLGEGFPRTVGIVHGGGGRLGPIGVRAVAENGGTDVVERRATTFFQEGRVVLLRMDLLRSCEPVDCDSDETCGASGCESIEVDGAGLPDWEGEPATRFPQPAVDAGTPTGDSGPCVPRGAETCNTFDDDCDGRTDEGFDIETDEMNCGRCDNPCFSGRMCCAGACVRGGC